MELWRRIVISSDHEREVIAVCGYTLIAVIICRPFFFFFCAAFVCNYLTRSLAQSGRAIVQGWGVKIELWGSNPEAGCRESANQKMSISSWRREKNRFSRQKQQMMYSRDEDGSSTSRVSPYRNSLRIHLTNVWICPHYSIWLDCSF